ncbi:DUF5134 domain-containing protein [Streptomyces oryzae]|uniref:DUF5134 domain-containing protein n=1 Tax=Streptomyces oryzae TaxID=1434886 RepID=A0ABS3XL26_9ACTN|nr:DUF5134 domain-containing protein [Streptomyces oryzae]MBO8196113.1 DUF5134 domain-containing protein [Streptomyces oryzae]
MHGPATVGWLLVALCAVTGASCVLRARGAGRGQRAEAQGEAAMGFGMAAMAVPVLWHGAPRVHTTAAWSFTAVFGLLLMRELWLVAGGRHRGGCRSWRLHHVLSTGAMAYMALCMALSASAGTGAHGAGAGGVPALTGTLLVYFAGYVLWTGTRLMPVMTGAPAGAAAGAHGGQDGQGGMALPVVRQAGVAAGCRVAMGAGMFAMLLSV